MPFAKRVVSPIRLGRKPISEEDKFEKTVVCNNTLVGVLQQLSSLAYFADDLFHELNQECLTVIRRTSRLVRKVKHVENQIDQLDFKAVKVPAGDLKTYKGVTEHFKTEYGLDTLLFAPTTRPDCVIDLYDASALSPIQAIRQCNGFRKDGKTGSKLFSLAPVVREDALYGVDSEVDIASPLHHGDFERKPREPKTVKQRPRSLSTLKELEAFQDESKGTQLEAAATNGNHKSVDMLPSLSTDLVPIDVTGSGFVRMCEYRESIRTNSREYIEECESRDTTLKRRRHRRRQTVSGIPLSGAGDITHGFIVQSESDLRIRSVSRERLERPKSMAYMDRYAPRPENNRKSREELRREKEGSREDPGLARSCSFRRSMRSLFRGDKEKSKSSDLWVQGRPESPGPPMVDLDYPLRRSKSLPRSLKSMSKSLTKLFSHSRSASTEGRLDSKSEDDVDMNEGARKPRKTKKETITSNTPDQGFVTVVSKSKKPKSLRKNLTKRMSKSQSQMNQATISGRPPLPLNFTPKHSPRQTKNNRLARPKSLEFGLVAGDNSKSPKQQRQKSQHLHQPIPVNTPLTPSSDGVFTPSPAGSSGGAIGMKKHRLNIPPGQAWKAFGDIHYRGGGGVRGRGERQSSSGHWSATDSSVRYSTESDYPRSSSSPERGSSLSADRDSAISFNMQDMHNVTTDNNPEDDTSTLNSDRSMFVDDGSTVLGEDSDDTLNGSVVNAGVKVTSQSEGWINSLSRTKDTKEMKDRRKKRRSRKDRSKGVTNSPSGLTVMNVRTHDGETYVNRRTGDEASSVYSQDTDGFYTSMHTDSGLKHSLDDMLSGTGHNGTSEGLTGMRMSISQMKGLQGVTVPITLHNNTLRSDSFKLATGRLNTSKNIPLPPPRRSSALSKDNKCPSPQASSVHEDELDRILASSFSLNSSKSNDSRESRLSQTVSETSLQMMDESLVSESDPELIYTRVKDKTSITTAGYPSLCSVTPLNSEDEDMLAFSREWRNGTTESVPSSEAPTPTPESAGNKIPTSTPMVLEGGKQSLSSLFRMNRIAHPALEVSRESSGTDRSLDESSMSWEFDVSGMDLIDTSIYSTWPRKNVETATPTQEMVEGSKAEEEGKPHDAEAAKPVSVGTATYVPSLRLFNVGSLEDLPSVRQSLPQVKTPDSLLDGNKRAISNFSNTFHIPSDHKFTFDTDNMASLSMPSPPQKQSSPLNSNSSSSMIQDGKTVAAKPPVARKLDKNEAFHLESPGGEVFGGMMSTWPRKKDSPCSPKFFDDSELNSSMSPTMEKAAMLDEKSWTHTFPRKKNKKMNQRQHTVPDSLDLNTSLDHTALLPAQARLIISSPISKQAEYIDNPHKRSLCSPVSEKDLVAFSQFNQNNTPPKRIPAVLARSTSNNSDQSGALVKKSSTMLEFSTTLNQTDTESVSAFRPVSKPLYPTLGSMKHSISFPETAEEKVNPSNYNRSWYDGIQQDKETPQKADTASANEDRLSQTGYPFAAFLNDSFLCSLESSTDKKRQSLVSNNSTSSSGSGKKSVSFASDLRLSQNSLNRSDTVSVSSIQTTGTEHSYTSKNSKSSFGGILTSFRKKSLESLKSNDSQSSVHSSESVKLRSGKVVHVDVSNASSFRKSSLKDSTNNNTPLLQTSNQSPVKPETSVPEKTMSSSPQKRSSAIFDDESSDVDMYMQVMQQQTNPAKKLGMFSNEKNPKSRADDRPPTGLSQNVKRHCTDAITKVKSPARSSSFKKNRLKRTPSRPSVRVRMAGDSCEVVNMGESGSNFSPSKKGLDLQPFSSIIMKSAPSKVTVTLPFEFNTHQDVQSVNQTGQVEPTMTENVAGPVVHQINLPVKSVSNGHVIVNVQHLDDDDDGGGVPAKSTVVELLEHTAKSNGQMNKDDDENHATKTGIRREVSLSSFSTSGLEEKKKTTVAGNGGLMSTGVNNKSPLNVQPFRGEKGPSAFSQESDRRHIRPSPPKSVLPKLRSLSSEPSAKGHTKELAKDTHVSEVTMGESAFECVQGSHGEIVQDSRKSGESASSKVSNVDKKDDDTHAQDNAKLNKYNGDSMSTGSMPHRNRDNIVHIKRQTSKPACDSKLLEKRDVEQKPTLPVQSKASLPLEQVKQDVSKSVYPEKNISTKTVQKSVSVSEETDEEISEKENRYIQGKPPAHQSHNLRLRQNARPDSSYGSTTSLNYLGQTNNGQFGQSDNPLTKSLTNLSCLSLYRGESTFSLAQSSYSLARSTDSLASTSSERAEKVKAAKLAFLQSQNQNPKQQSHLDERFAKHTLGTKKLSESRTSLSSKSCVNFSSDESNRHTTSDNKPSNTFKSSSTVLHRLQHYQNNTGSTTTKSDDISRKTHDVTKDREPVTIVPLEKPPVSYNRKSPHTSVTAENQQKRLSRHLVDNASTNPVPGKLISSLLNKFQN